MKGAYQKNGQNSTQFVNELLINKKPCFEVAVFR